MPWSARGEVRGPRQIPFLRLELVRGDPVAQDFPVEGLRIDMQEGGGLGAVAAHLLQGRDDVLSLDVLQAPARRPRRRLPGADLGGEILRLDLVLGADLLYEARNAEQLAELLPDLGGELLLAEPGRPYAKEFLERFKAEPVGQRIYRLAC